MNDPPAGPLLPRATRRTEGAFLLRVKDAGQQIFALSVMAQVSERLSGRPAAGKGDMMT